MQPNSNIKASVSMTILSNIFVNSLKRAICVFSITLVVSATFDLSDRKISSVNDKRLKPQKTICASS